MTVIISPQSMYYRILDGQDTIGDVAIKWVNDDEFTADICSRQHGGTLSVESRHMKTLRQAIRGLKIFPEFSVREGDGRIHISYGSGAIAILLQHQELFYQALLKISWHVRSVKDSFNYAEKLHNQASALHSLNEAVKYKNRMLDALHYVWCSGGCGGGVHRYSGNGLGILAVPVTEELVRTAESNTERLRTWFENHRFREWPGFKKWLYFKTRYRIRQFIQKLYWKLL